MRKSETKGFNYYLSKEVLERYKDKPIELRLKWLYMGNILRKNYSKSVIKIQDKFRAK